jgi:hypothetical protein
MLRESVSRLNSGRVTSAIVWIGACISLVGCVQEQDRMSDAVSGITMLLDINYRNGGTSENLLQPTVGRSVRSMGFTVLEKEGAFDQESLQDVDIVLIAGAVAPEHERDDPSTLTSDEIQEQNARANSLPAVSAFTESEIDALRNWVEGGGALMIMVDHMPWPGGVSELANTFGAQLSNGSVIDSSKLTGVSISEIPNLGRIHFRRANGTLQEHAISNGFGDGQRVEDVLAWEGSAIRLPENAESILTLGPTYISLLPEVYGEYSESAPTESVAGWSQLGVLSFGRGRVAISADWGIVASEEPIPFGRPQTALPVEPQEIQNAQLFANTLKWLVER